MAGIWRSINSGTPSGYLHLDDPRVGVWAGSNDGGIKYGLDVQTGPDQGSKLQAAINHAGRNGVPNTILIAGFFRCGQNITFPTDVAVHLEGFGASDNIDQLSSGILFFNDSGPNPESILAQYGLKTNNGKTVFMESFTVAGPNYGGTNTAFGKFPANLSGIYVEGACFFTNMRVYGFGAGIGVNNDHHKFENCNFQGNGYNVNFIHNPSGGLGDETFSKCQLTNASRASIGLCDTNTIANARFGDNGHSGGAPYGVYRYSNKDGVTASCSGSNGSAILTSVNSTTRAPAIGGRVEADNVPWGAKIIGVSGISGNYTITLNVLATGPVTSVRFFVPPRNTAIVGIVQENWSWEGIGNAVFYDEPNYEYDSPAGWSGITLDSPADVSSFGAQELRWAQIVTANGTNGSTTLTGVTLTDWRPLIGDMVENAWTYPETATPILLDTVVTSVSGTSGNWTIGISKPLVATLTQIRIGKPIRRCPYDVGYAQNFYWRAGSMPVIAAEQPGRPIPHIIRARAIIDVLSDYISIPPASDFPLTEYFEINDPSREDRGISAYGANLDGISLGTATAGSLKNTASVRYTSENVLEGQVLEFAGLNACRPYRADASSLILGVAHTNQNAQKPVMIITGGTSGFIKVRNSSGASIPAQTLIKAHASGGVAEASGPNDGPIIGRTHDSAIASGALGSARILIR